jgi:hypothetical protein
MLLPYQTNPFCAIWRLANSKLVYDQVNRDLARRARYNKLHKFSDKPQVVCVNAEDTRTGLELVDDLLSHILERDITESLNSRNHVELATIEFGISVVTSLESYEYH